jgi:hypothetical protein
MRIVGVLIFLLVFVLVSGNSYAITVFADIEGTEKSGENSVNISGTYTNGCMTYTISPHTAGSLARIEALDGDTETLWLRNVKITAGNDCVDSGHIYFWATFAAPPNTATGPNKSVSIARTANGLFTPATFGNWITVTGWAQHNPVNPNPPDGVSGSWEQIIQSDSHTVTCPTCGAFTKTRTKKWDPALGQTFTGAHVLKGEIWFKLENNGNTLVFDNTAAKGVKLNGSTAAGGTGDECPVECLGGN